MQGEPREELHWSLRMMTGVLMEAVLYSPSRAFESANGKRSLQRLVNFSAVGCERPYQPNRASDRVSHRAEWDVRTSIQFLLRGASASVGECHPKQADDPVPKERRPRRAA